MKTVKGYHGEWNMVSPGGWEYQRVAQGLGQMAWDRFLENVVVLEVDRPWSEILQQVALTGGMGGEDLKLKSGRLLTLTASALAQGAGHILVMLDVTETRRLQQRLNRRERLTAMGEMSAQLAHQMRTPLSTALLYTSHLAVDQLEGGKRRQFTAKLRQRLQHMERQIQDILLFARGGEAGDSVLTVTEALHKFVTAAEQTLAAHATQIILHDRSQGAARMIGREDALQGLFNNLLDNAIQHHATRIEITLRVGNEIEIDFEDDGDGVPESLQEQIFDPFFTTRSGGTGLGLAVVQNLVLGHGGEIHLQQGRRSGACFRIRFPLALEAADGISTTCAPDNEQERATRSLS